MADEFIQAFQTRRGIIVSLTATRSS